MNEYAATHTAIGVNVPCAPPPTYEAVVAQCLPYLNFMASPRVAVVTQPQPIAGFRSEYTHSFDWMTRPFGVVPNCPHGLEYLSTLDQLLIQQKDSQTNKTYAIKNSLGQNVYMAIEDTENVSKDCFGNDNSDLVNIKLCDLYKNEIIRFSNPSDCCSEIVEISTPPDGQIIASLHEEWAWWCPPYKIQDQNGETVLRIIDSSPSACSPGIYKRIIDMNGMEIGQISTKSDLAQELFTDDNFLGVNFPMDLDVTMKAALISACMLFDFNHFEFSSDCDP